MAKSKRPMIPCTTCGALIVKPILPNDRPRCFPCMNAEIMTAANEYRAAQS